MILRLGVLSKHFHDGETNDDYLIDKRSEIGFRVYRLGCI